MTSSYAANYRNIGDTTYDVWESEFRRLNSPFLPQLAPMYQQAKPHTALCLAQMFVENKYGTTGHIIKPADNNPLSLRPWDDDPRGLPQGTKRIITAPDGGKFLSFALAEDCIREWKRRLFDDPNYKGGIYTMRLSLDAMLDTYAPPGDVHPVTGVDNADISYADTVRTMLKRYQAAEGDLGGSDVAGMKKHRLPGYSKDFWLPDDITLIIDIAEGSKVRSYSKRTKFTNTTWHDTGNPNTTAAGENKWLQDGRPGGSAGGYNFIFGDKTVYYTVPLDEVTWAAGTATGNNVSAHAEQALNVKSWEDTLRTGAAVHGAIIAAEGWTVDAGLVQHNVWYGKNCPGQIRKRGEWPKVVGYVREAVARVKEAMGQPQTTTEPPVQYGTPVPIDGLDMSDVSKGDTAKAIQTVDGIDFVFVYDVVEAIRDTPRLRYASGDERVGPDIKQGEQFVVAWLFTYNGTMFYLTPWNTRVRVEDTRRVDDAVEEGG